MNDVVNTEPQGRKRDFVFDLGPGAHQCWYPVALSTEIPIGKAIGTDLGDGRIVVYRGEDGVARAMSAYCKHMGADLSYGGEVVVNNIRCPYHHWAFGDGGHCKSIPSGDDIPRGTNLVQFPLEEQYGLIWVFFGETPLYDLAKFEEFDSEKYVVRSCEAAYDEPVRVEPWILATNAFDLAHVRFLHGVNVIGSEVKELNTYHRRMFWKMGEFQEKDTGTWNPYIDLYGVNSIRTKGEMDGRLKWYIAAHTPSGRRGTRTFFTIITTKDDGAEAFLDRAEALHNRLVNEDLPIVNNMRLGDLHLVGADREMARFMRFARKYPRTTLDSLESAANAPKRKGL